MWCHSSTQPTTLIWSVEPTSWWWKGTSGTSMRRSSLCGPLPTTATGRLASYHLAFTLNISRLNDHLKILNLWSRWTTDLFCFNKQKFNVFSKLFWNNWKDCVARFMYDNTNSHSQLGPVSGRWHLSAQLPVAEIYTIFLNCRLQLCDTWFFFSDAEMLLQYWN